MKNIKNRIRIAIQKSGRLSEESLRLLMSCGITIKPRKDQLFCHSENFPLDVLLVRDDDIPSLVAEGICDYGIVGTNLLQEQALASKNSNNNLYVTIRYLGFAFCKLAIAVPTEFSYQGLSSLENRRIATSYPNLLNDFLNTNNINAEVITLSGSIEIAPRLGISDCVCDLVSTGATLEANNLIEAHTIFESQAVLIRTKRELVQETKRIADIFQNRIEGSELANGSKYIMLHAPKSALQSIVTLLPGAERPTVLELQGDNQKVAIHALCRENIFWETMEKLKQAGASSILVLPVEKMLN
jgi:ATP phosphoribosyltransferase